MVEGCEQPTALQSHLVQFAASLLALLNPLAEVAIVLGSHANPDGVSGLLATEWQRQGLSIQHGIDQGRTPPSPTLRPTHV
jgi:hypothetical protein